MSKAGANVVNGQCATVQTYLSTSLTLGGKAGRRPTLGYEFRVEMARFFWNLPVLCLLHRVVRKPTADGGCKFRRQRCQTASGETSLVPNCSIQNRHNKHHSRSRQPLRLVFIPRDQDRCGRRSVVCCDKLARLLAFAWDSEIDYLLAIVTLFFAIFFTLFLLTASFSVHDARWPVRHTSFREFLKSNIRIGRGTMSGREVLFEIALIPVALAFGATLIGLAWVIFG